MGRNIAARSLLQSEFNFGERRFFFAMIIMHIPIIKFFVMASIAFPFSSLAADIWYEDNNLGKVGGMPGRI